LETENDKKLEIASNYAAGGKISKKRKMKLDKIMADDTLTEKEKELLVARLYPEDTSNKRVKRSQLGDYRDKKHFLSTDRSTGRDGYDPSVGKVNTSSLWGEDERAFLEDVTLNLVPDDDAMMDTKGKTVMKWDSNKRRHVLMKVDRDGKVIKEKRNESGAKITKKQAEKGAEEQKIYKKWMKKTHMKLQSVGEQEDQRAINLARSTTEGRVIFKQFKNRHDLTRGEDPRASDTMIENKKKKLMDKMKAGKRGGHGPQEKYGEKSWKKI